MDTGRANLSPSKARALEPQAGPDLAVFYTPRQNLAFRLLKLSKSWEKLAIQLLCNLL
jgi:hypothetical protein